MKKVAFTTITAIALAIAFAEPLRAQEPPGLLTAIGERTVSVACIHERIGSGNCTVSLYTNQEHDRVKQRLESLILHQANTLSADLAASETIKALQGRIEALEEKINRLEQAVAR